tara:strand:+ start:723 stop:2747 length:2025 start_codon:yes stop_codon:yes gene_type:complete
MSVSISLFAGAGGQFFDNNGAPLSGGLLYTYAAGTTTPQTTYTTSVGNIANANPIVLNSAGRTANEIWLTNGLSYKFILATSVNTQIGSYDNISGANDLSALSVSSGSSLIGFIQSGANAVAETVQDKLRQSVSVKDFGAIGNGSTDDTAAIQNAINSVRTGTLYFPKGTYKVSDTINIGTDGTVTALNLIGTLPDAPIAATTWSTVIDASTLGVSKPLFNVGGLSLNCDSTAIIGMKLLGPGQNGSIGVKLTTYATAADYRGSGDSGPLPEGSGAVVRVANCMITGFSYGILGLSFLSTIEENELRELSEAILIWPYTNDLRIYNNHFFGNTSASIDSGRFGSTVPGVQSGNMIIQGNQFEAQGASSIDVNLNNALWSTVTDNVFGSGGQYNIYVANTFSAYDINWLSIVNNKFQGGSTASVLIDQTPTGDLPSYDQITIVGNSLGSLIINNAPKIIGDIYNQFNTVNSGSMNAGAISYTRGQLAPRTPNITLISNGNFATNSGASYSQSNATYPYSGGTIPTGWTVDIGGSGVKLFWDVDGPLGTTNVGYRASTSQYAFDVRRDSSGSAGTVYFYQDVTVETNTVYTAVAFGVPVGVTWALQITDTSGNIVSQATTASGVTTSYLFAATTCNSNAKTTLRIRFATTETNTMYLRYVALYEGYWPAGSIGYPN